MKIFVLATQTYAGDKIKYKISRHDEKLLKEFEKKKWRYFRIGILSFTNANEYQIIKLAENGQDISPEQFMQENQKLLDIM